MGRYQDRRAISLIAAAQERKRKAAREAREASYKNSNASGTVNVNDVDAPFRIIDGKQVDGKWNGKEYVW